MAPGVLGVEQQAVLRVPHQSTVLPVQLRIQAAGQLIAAARAEIMLDGIRGGADAMGPPVIEVAPENRRVLQLRGNLAVQLLQADHAHPHLVSIPLMEALDRAQDQRLRRGVVAEHAGHRRGNEVIGIAVFLTLGQVIVQILCQRFHVVPRLRIAAEAVEHHEIDGMIGAQAEHISQIIMLAVPDQQAAAVRVLPEIGVLVLPQRVHPVMTVNISV